MTVIVAFSACNNDDLTIGKSLTSEADKLDVTSAAFPVATRTVTVDSVVARTSDCYFGRIKDPETGAYITTDFMSQFHILESFELVDEDSIVSKENGQVVADSCELLIYLDEASVFCDSLAAMKMRISELGATRRGRPILLLQFRPRTAGLPPRERATEDQGLHLGRPHIHQQPEERQRLSQAHTHTRQRALYRQGRAHLQELRHIHPAGVLSQPCQLPQFRGVHPERLPGILL